MRRSSPGNEKSVPGRPDQAPQAPSAPAPSHPGDGVAAFRHLMEHSGDGYFEVDLKGSFTFANAAACRFTGWPLEELIGLHYRAIMTPEQAERNFKLYNEVYRTGRPSPLIEYELIRKDGSLAINETTAALMRDAQGVPIGFFGMVRDLTEKSRLARILAESEEKHRYILANMEEVYYETDLAGRFTDFNAAACESLGYDRQELLGKNFRECMDAETAQRVFQRFSEVYRTGQPARILECKLIQKDGAVRIHELSVSLLKNAAGEPMGFFGVSRDRTDQLRMEQALRESEESYRRVMELAPDMFVITRVADNRFVAVNDAFCARTGFSREELVGHTAVELGLYTDPENRRKWLEMLRRDGQVRGIELQFRARNGVIQDDLFSAQYIRFKGEDCILSVITSITHLKQIQRSLQEREENQRTILDTAPYAITIIRQSDLCYMQVNKSFCHNTGYARDEVLGRSPEDFSILADPADRGRMREALMRDGRFDGMEIRFRKKNGTILEALVSGRPIKFEGQPCLLIMSADISALKATQQELERYQKSLEQMVAERTRELEAAQTELVKRERLAVLGQLTATVSHELRNPLGVIRSSNFYLQRKTKEQDEKTLKHFRRIEEQVALCDTIVGDLLEYTRSRRANMVRQALESWLPQVVEQMQESEGLEIGLRIPADLPPWSHDREKMRRVIVNVLENALQAVRDQEKTLKADCGYRPTVCLEAERQTDSVVLTIVDNGAGMDAETCRRAFEPLFTTRARGTGIGLANVKKIVKEHGGHIELESCPGQGTRMRIFLPLNADISLARPAGDVDNGPHVKGAI